MRTPGGFDYPCTRRPRRLAAGRATLRLQRKLDYFRARWRFVVEGGPEVEWVAGISRRWWNAGFLTVMLGSGFSGDLLGDGVRLLPQSPPSILLALAPFLFAVAIGLPALYLYFRFVPTLATIGIMNEGLIVDFGRPSAGPTGFRQGYRWEELRWRGRRLLLPVIRPAAPRSLRLTALQHDRVGRRIAPG